MNVKWQKYIDDTPNRFWCVGAIQVERSDNGVWPPLSKLSRRGTRTRLSQAPEGSLTAHPSPKAKSRAIPSLITGTRARGRCVNESLCPYYCSTTRNRYRVNREHETPPLRGRHAQGLSDSTPKVASQRRYACSFRPRCLGGSDGVWLWRVRMDLRIT